MEGGFLEWLILVLIALLFGEKTLWPVIAQKLGFKNPTSVGSAKTDVMADTRNALQPLQTTMDELKMHFNHETTDLLTDIRDGIEKINAKHEEWDKYGINTRECAKR